MHGKDSPSCDSALRPLDRRVASLLAMTVPPRSLHDPWIAKALHDPWIATALRASR